jgi:hypothetical protein
MSNTTAGQIAKQLSACLVLSGFLATGALCAAFSVPVVVAQEEQQKPDAEANSKQACERDTQSKQTTRDPIEQSDDLKTKVTLGIYFVSGGRTYDINARHQFGHLTAWVAGYFDPKSDSLARIGAQYDCQYKWIHFVPTLELASTGGRCRITLHRARWTDLRYGRYLSH